MTSRYSAQNRRLRKLPMVIRRNRNNRPVSPSTTFYSYQNALMWMRNQKDVISKFIQLLYTYPNLVQDESLDRFWEFLEPLLPDEKEARSRESSSDMDTSDNSSSSLRLTGVQVLRNTSTSLGRSSEQSASEEGKTPENRLQEKTPRLLIINHFNDKALVEDTFLQRAVMGTLQENFYVLAPKTSAPRPFFLPVSKRVNPIEETDLCVYLFSESTLENADCFLNLCLALSKSLPVVYVKRHNQKLPDNFLSVIRRNSKGRMTVKEFLESQHEMLPPAAAMPLKKRLQNRNKVIEFPHRPSSAQERNRDGRRGKRRHSPVTFDNEMTRVLIHGFKNAVVIGETDHRHSGESLKETIYRTLASFNIKSEILQTSPEYSAGKLEKRRDNVNELHLSPQKTNSQRPSSLSETGVRERFLTHSVHTDNVESSESGPLFRSSVRTIKLPPLEQPTTTYLLFDRNHTSDGPKKVEFPFQQLPEFLVDSDLESEDLEPVQSPIQFHEIDLSRQVNGRMTPDSDNSCSSLF